MSTTFWVWAAAALLFLILELMTPTLVFVSFAVASLAAMVLSYFHPEAYYWQIGLFVVVAAILLPLTRSAAKKITKPSPQKSNVDALVGKIALVTKSIDPNLGGQVKIEGEVWMARSDAVAETGEKVRIVGVTGAKVLVEKLSQEKE